MRGEWIEMCAAWPTCSETGSLPMRGEWIEIVPESGRPSAQRLSPCGESGLKCHVRPKRLTGLRRSLPMRGEWIEMWSALWSAGSSGLSPCGESGLKSFRRRGWIHPRQCLSPCGESGLKSAISKDKYTGEMSLPMRGEWIEIPTEGVLKTGSAVSPHAGRVD